MRFKSSRGSESEQPGTSAQGAWILPTILAGSAILGTVTLLSFAQTASAVTFRSAPPADSSRSQPSSGRERADGDAGTRTRERQNFDAANAERLAANDKGHRNAGDDGDCFESGGRQYRFRPALGKRGAQGGDDRETGPDREGADGTYRGTELIARQSAVCQRDSCSGDE